MPRLQLPTSIFLPFEGLTSSKLCDILFRINMHEERIMTAYLILENGRVFQGEFFGAAGEAVGEVVFTTGMTGYLETITDPGYHGQIILQSFPLIGNYGVIPADLEKDSISAKAYICKYPCQEPSNYRNEGDLDTFFMSKGIVGVKGIDTRALAKLIRDNGVMNAKITSQPPTEADRVQAAAYKIEAAIPAVSCKEVKTYGSGNLHVALLDFGMKDSLVKSLMARGCKVSVFPHDASPNMIMSMRPDGIMLSSGPGDPADPTNQVIIDNLKELIKLDIPMFGVCMGHLLLARAKGFETTKMKFGHHGSNQPVKDLKTGRVYISSQNHGYAAVAAREDCYFVNVNDGSCEGMDYGRSFSVQFQPEGRSGPTDTAFLFDKFVENMKEARNA